MSEQVNPEEAVANALWERFVAATNRHPRGMFFRVGDEGIKMKILMVALSDLIAPLILEVESLRRKVKELEEEVDV